MLNNEVLDDPLLFDGTRDFTGGMVNLVRPNLLDETSSEDLQNIDIDRAGRPITRIGATPAGDPGDANQVRGLAFFELESSKALVRIANGAAKYYDGASWASIGTYTAGAGTEQEMAQLAGKLYITDGATGLFSWTGSGAAVVVSSANPPPICKYIVSHTGRIFAAGLSGGSTTPDELDASEILDASLFLAANKIQIGGDQAPITGLAPWHNFLLTVFKRDKTYMVNADPTLSAANWTVDLIHRSIGCVAHRSIQSVGDDLFFLADDGVRSLRRTINDNQIGVQSPISDPIRPLIRRINWSFVNTCCSAFHGNRYFLAVPIDSATTPNYVLVYNVLLQRWSGYWTGWSPTLFAVTQFTGAARKLVFGRTDGAVWEWMDYKTSPTSSDYYDNGVAYQSKIITRGYTFRNQTAPKTGYHYEVEFYDSDADVTITVKRDGRATESSYSGPSRGGLAVLPIDLPFILPISGHYPVARDLMFAGPFYMVQLEITAPEKRIGVQSVTLSGFQDTIEEERNG